MGAGSGQMKTVVRTAAGTLAAAAIAAMAVSCTVGPDYARPTVLSAPAAAAYKSPATQPTSIGEIPIDWWRLFNDPVLDELESQAGRASPTAQAAAARVTQARAAARSTYADLFPQLTFEPTIERARTPANSVGTGQVSGGTTGTGTNASGNVRKARTSNTSRIPFDLTYELDVWGRVRRGYESAVAQVRSSEADYEVVMQTVRADVATNYFSLRSLDLQLKIFAQTVESYQRQVDLTARQFKAGVVGKLDVAQANAQLKTTLAQLTDTLRQRADLEHALATLVGKTPAEVDLAVRPLDLAPPIVPPALPTDLLRRRPDVYEAEQNLVAANADVGVAVAAFYPQIQLTGSAGFESFDVRKAVDWEQRIWSLGAGLTLPLFDGGRIQANVDQAQARYDELLADYKSTILTAVRDVEDSLTDLRLRAEQAKSIDEAVAASREYLELSQRQYAQGLIGYFTVIDAERTLLNNEVSAAQVLNQRLASTILLIKSLGGGWQPGGVVPSVDTLPKTTAMAAPAAPTTATSPVVE